MKLRIIKAKEEYEAVLDWVDQMFNKKVKPDTPEGETLQVALLSIKKYEDEHFPIPTIGESVPQP